MLMLVTLTTLLSVSNAFFGPHLPQDAVTYENPYSYHGSYHPAIVAPAINSHQSNVLRTYGNLGAVSTYMKSLGQSYSSVRKTGIRIDNPSYATSHSPAAAIAPIAVAAPDTAIGHAPITVPASNQAYTHVPYQVVSTPNSDHGLANVAYAPAAAVAHTPYSNPIGLNYNW